jgi:hypothetical protein
MVDQVSRQFLAPKLDRFGIEAGNAREGRDGGSVGVVGKASDIPATLGLTHATEQQVDVAVVAGKRRVRASLAGLTRAAMDSRVRRCCHPRILHHTGRSIAFCGS